VKENKMNMEENNKFRLDNSQSYSILLTDKETGLPLGMVDIEFDDKDPVLYIASPKQINDESNDLRVRIRKGSCNVKDLIGSGIRLHKEDK
jgi:hypothetical protein